MPINKRPIYTNRPPIAFFFTGAGLSADSGIPTFFGSNGAYAQFASPEQAISAKMLKMNPQLLYRFIDDRRVELGQVEPNAAHYAVARLAKDYGTSFRHVTQNIDDLVERAGYDGSVHVHGFLTRMRQLANRHKTVDIGYTRYWDGDLSLAPARGFQFRAEDTNSLYRPDVELFGEWPPHYADLNKAVKRLQSDDIAVVIGTRGEVVQIGDMLAPIRCKKILLNLHPSDTIGEQFFDTVIHDRASEAIHLVEEAVRQHLGAPVVVSTTGHSM